MRPFRLLLALLASVSLVAAACDDEEQGVTPDVGVEEEGADVSPDEQEEGVAEDVVLEATLEPLNDTGVEGTATVEVADGRVTVSVETRGFDAGLPHAQHIHIGGRNECPDSDDPEVIGDDELLSTAEGQPAYGPVMVSLTTDGDVGAASALAVERFPVSQDGVIIYERTFDLPSGVTVEDLENGVVVQHGWPAFFGDEQQYDGEPKSSLDPKLPLEATIPIACGELDVR